MSEITNYSAVKFRYGDANKFSTIEKDSNTIYFIHDDAGNKRIYVGDDCYNVTVVDTLDSDVILSDKSVPSTYATKTALNSKVGLCQVVGTEATTLPDVIDLENNVEYRYVNIDEITGVTVRSAQRYEPDLFYCSIILNTVNSSDSVADFVTVSSDSGVNIRFLNADVNLSDMDTLELLFFWNGLDICCIASAYVHEEV